MQILFQTFLGIQSETITAVVYVAVVLIAGERLNPCTPEEIQAIQSGNSCYTQNTNTGEFTGCRVFGCCTSCYKIRENEIKNLD